MATVALTADTFGQTVTGDGIVLVDFWAGALPGPALEQVITGVRGLDMDDVRARIAERKAAGTVVS